MQLHVSYDETINCCVRTVASVFVKCTDGAILIRATGFTRLTYRSLFIVFKSDNKIRLGIHRKDEFQFVADLTIADTLSRR